MNTNQKLHQAKLTQWAALIQEQAKSGLTVKDWCAQNGVSLHAYNYWKHLLKSEYVDAKLPEIVPVSLPQTPAPQQQSAAVSCDSRDSRELRNSYNSSDPAILFISSPGIDISIAPSVSDDLVLGIIKAVRHA